MDTASGARADRSSLRAEAASRAAAISTYLTPERRNVLILHGNSADFLADLFAVWLAGGVALCASRNSTAGEMTRIARFADVSLILARHDVKIDHPAPVADAPIRGKNAEGQLAVSADDPALILFTSGTTGEPKGVVLSHRALLARTSLNVAHIATGALDRALCLLPSHFGHGLIGNCLTPLLAGGTVYFAENSGVSTAAGLGGAIDDHQITFLSSVPSLWKLVLRLGQPPKLDSLRRISIGSAPLTASMWQEVADWAAGAEVANMYGLTETANWVAEATTRTHKPEDGLVGVPWGGAIAVRDANGAMHAHGQGEVMLNVPSVMLGYFKRVDLTADVLDRGWYATGDIGSLGDDGLLRLTGRAKYLIIQSGINVFPEELDALLERHPAVAEAAAFGLDDPVSGQCAAIAVVLKDGRNESEADLMKWTAGQIRPEAAPRHIMLVDDLGRNDRGKINRDELAKRLGSKA